MGRFLVLLLLSSLLFLSFDYGFGRVALMETHQQEIPIRTIAKYDIADYSDPHPNTNPKNGYITNPSAPTPTHPPTP